MGRILPPPPLNYDGNLASNWRKWKKKFTIYMTATQHMDKPDDIKSSLLLHYIGAKSRRVYSNFTFDQGDELKYDKVIEKFEGYMLRKENLTRNRYKFFTYRQIKGQTFAQYYKELTSLANECELGLLYDSVLKDMIVVGLYNKKLQKLLLHDSSLSLNKLIATCQTYELTKKQAKAIHRLQVERELFV